MTEEYSVEAVFCGISGNGMIIRGGTDKQIMTVLDQNAKGTGRKYGFTGIQVTAVQIAGNDPESLSPVRRNKNIAAMNVMIGIRILLTDFFQNRCIGMCVTDKYDFHTCIIANYDGQKETDMQ